MQWLNGVYTQRFNKRHKRVGQIFQGRFKSFLVEDSEYLPEVLRYVVLNPVRGGMVKRLEEYKWSSYRALARYEEAPSWLATDRFLGRIRSDRKNAQLIYREHVDQRLQDSRFPHRLGGAEALSTLFQRTELRSTPECGSPPFTLAARQLRAAELHPHDNCHPELVTLRNGADGSSGGY